jgi:hypothetical protein
MMVEYVIIIQQTRINDGEIESEIIDKIEWISSSVTNITRVHHLYIRWDKSNSICFLKNRSKGLLHEDWPKMERIRPNESLIETI